MAIITEIKKSSKNIVIKTDDDSLSIYTPIIKKTFTDEIDYWTELYFYKQFSYFEYIPKLVVSKENTLYLEYISGTSLYDIPQIASDTLLLLARTLASFHNLSYNSGCAMSLTHHDTNLNNYILRDDKVYMIDFTDIILAPPLSDAYSLLLFLGELFSTHIFTDFVNSFFSEYCKLINFPISHSVSLFQNELYRFKKRREIHFKNIHQYEVFQANVEWLTTYCRGE